MFCDSICHEEYCAVSIQSFEMELVVKKEGLANSLSYFPQYKHMQTRYLNTIKWYLIFLPLLVFKSLSLSENIDLDGSFI